MPRERLNTDKHDILRHNESYLVLQPFDALKFMGYSSVFQQRDISEMNGNMVMQCDITKSVS